MARADFWSQSRAIEKNLFVLSEVGAETDHVTLISDHENQLILSKESKDSGVCLPDFVAGLNGERNVLAISELEAHDRMTDPSHTPGRKKQVYSREDPTDSPCDRSSSCCSRSRCDSHNYANCG